MPLGLRLNEWKSLDLTLLIWGVRVDRRTCNGGNERFACKRIRNPISGGIPMGV